MKASLLYHGNGKSHSSESFLAKNKLREIFSGCQHVTLDIIYNRKVMKAAGRDGKYIVKSNYPKPKIKSRMINL